MMQLIHLAPLYNLCSQLSKQGTMADKSLGKVPVERLIVLITEHVEMYDMSNRLYHNATQSIWKQIGLILPICHFVDT